MSITKSGFGNGLSLYDGNLNILRGADHPAVGDGVEAPVSSLYIRDTGSTAAMFLKTGSGDTDWQTITTDEQSNSSITSSSTDSVTTEITADEVLVDESRLVEWLVTAVSTADSSDRTTFSILAIHDGSDSADAEYVTWQQLNILNTEDGVSGITPLVDLDGVAGSQKMRLRVSSTQSCDIEVMRMTMAWSTSASVGNAGSLTGHSLHDLQFDGDVTPGTDDSYDLGSISYGLRNIFSETVTAGGTGPRLSNGGKPASPRNGDIWVDGGYVYVRSNDADIQLS